MTISVVRFLRIFQLCPVSNNDGTSDVLLPDENAMERGREGLSVCHYRDNQIETEFITETVASNSDQRLIAGPLNMTPETNSAVSATAPVNVDWEEQSETENLNEKKHWVGEGGTSSFKSHSVRFKVPPYAASRFIFSDCFTIFAI